MTNEKINDVQSLFLDVIRYFLAAVVVVGHGLGFFFGYFNGFFPDVIPHPQSIAVVCFFYLSGYLIVGSQLRQKSAAENTLYKYLFDRATRVYVTLLPSLLFIALVDLFFSRHTGVEIEIVKNFSSFDLFVKNLLLIPSMPFGTMRPIWSLMYEWWIYLLFGGLFFWRKNFVAATFLVLTGIYYTVRVNGHGEAGHIWLIWALGGGCAYLQNKVQWQAISNGLLNTAALFFLMASGSIYYFSKDPYNLSAGVFISLFLFVFSNNRNDFMRRLLPWKNIIRKLAGFSFTLFLTHYTVLVYTKEFLGMSGWSGLLSGFLASNLVAFSIASFTEFRLQSVKAFFSSLAKRFANMPR